ncbi:MAG TPA: FAD-binding oxidoreductase [Bacillales bacterium]|nr:FAD-binding oxidoreductase [Bacillales bacterium]
MGGRKLVLAELQNLLPGERIGLDDVNHPFGNQGAHVVYPETEEEIVSVLKEANEHGWKVVPAGGGTKKGFGGVEEKADILLSLSRFKGITEYETGDMTMAARPGTTMKEIVDHLAEHGQMLPIDASWPEYATIGGVIASNDSGPKRMKYGSARDFVIGLRVVYPDGKVIRTGGKVVKNVAGYDMNKLFIGSMGTLGVISEVRVKLRPLPQYESLVLLSFPYSKIEEIRTFAVELLNTTVEAASLELLTPELAEELAGRRNWTLAIAFEDREKAVHSQEDWVKGHLPVDTEVEILQQEEAKSWWQTFSRTAPYCTPDVSNSETEMALKIGSKNFDALRNLQAAGKLGDEHHLVVKGHGGLGHGISRVFVKGEPDDLLSYVKTLREIVTAKKGYVIIQHMPLTMRRQVSVWGNRPVYFPLLEGIKKTIDPNGILNPKRFVGGL